MIRPETCRECGHEFDAHTSIVDEVAKPDPGDVSICLYCGCISVYADGGGLREPTDAEFREIARDDQVRLLLMARGDVMEKEKGR